MSNDLKSVLYSVGAKFTADVRAGRYAIPPIPRGPGTEPFRAGDRVVTRSSAPYRLEGTVVDTWSENGYQKVVVNHGTERNPRTLALRASDLMTAK